MTFDEAAQRVWIAGVAEDNQPSLSALTGDFSPSGAALLAPISSLLMAPVQSLATSADASGSWLFATSSEGAFARAIVDANGVLSASTQLTFESGLVEAVATTPAGDLLVVVRSQPFGTPTYSIVRLTPAP
jgi:hypothetical protein